ncbi:murein biosynthesis integral membrane protein MurJ [Deinococcus detaillensis]|uniref:Murein biosynthesis integral membrane protein MurJ n=1 Tax=Deinococcus detaillensis TaxID=2592048 RepID=A0A553UW83_9DEIO|nr:murein biosynthesis integral membrane protein MurJ [Deinococcus detaillensis]TSA84459.1 murein biosynthesis integral membrane protein MurJ [Deinococcus detaillensis]
MSAPETAETPASEATLPPAPVPRSAARNTLIVMAGTLGSRLSGVVRQQLINGFGNELLDAFTIASRVPNLFRELLAEGALVNSFIPVYKSLGSDEKSQLARTFSGALIGINLILMVLGILAAPWIVDLLVAKNANIDTGLAIYMTRLVMPFLTLISLASIAMGLLNADEHFRESSFAPIAFNAVSIVILLVATVLFPHSATWLALSWLLGGLAQLLVQLPALGKYGLLPTPQLMTHPALGRVLVQMAPFTLTTGARQILNIYVQRLLTNAAFFPSGTAFAYSNAETLFTMVNGLFVVSPALALFPRFSQLAADNDWPSFKELTYSTLKTVTFLAAPASALLVALSGYAIGIFDLRGNMPLDRFTSGTLILTGWAIALVPWAINTVLLRTFYARQRTREAVVVSAVGFLLEVLLYNVVVPRLGLIGFGISTTISGVVVCFSLIYLYGRQLGFSVPNLAFYLARVVGLSVIAGIVAKLVSLPLPNPGPHQLLLSIFVLALAGGLGLASYLGLAAALNVGQARGLISGVRRRMGR